MQVRCAIVFVVGLSLRAQELVQPEDPALVFEVATVKSFVMPPPGEQMRLGNPTGPNRAFYVGRTLKMLISEAWGVKTYQVTGPGWLDSERYEITGVLPEGKTREQAKFMLQNLLAERFGLRMHRETKETAVYALQVGKNGPKLKESRQVPSRTDQTTAVNSAPPPRDKDGFVVLPEGRPAFAVTPGPNGDLQMASRMQTMDDFAAHLAEFAGFLGIAERPVLDRTGLTGRYDINIEFSATNRLPTGGAVAVPSAGGPAVAADPDSAPALATTLEHLGLKLGSAKAPITMFIVDQAKKTPEAN
jgi:uncharacterized protein (TIGR03435 family)